MKKRGICQLFVLASSTGLASSWLVGPTPMAATSVRSVKEATTSTRMAQTKLASMRGGFGFSPSPPPPSPGWFPPVTVPSSSEFFIQDARGLSAEQSKAALLHLGAVLDRGQAHNPTSGEYYKERIEAAERIIEQFLAANPSRVPTTMEEISGEWELVLTTVRYGIFRSSPFFLAIQEAYEVYAEDKEAFGMRKADLFFKLHELQTCSFGLSKVGRVAQTITSDYLFSEFDTSIFSLTVIPVIGWFKLLPTFGGCVITAANAAMPEPGLLQMKVDYTTARKVPGLQGLGEWIWKIKVPVGFIWKLCPWNKGRDALCKVYIRYVDDDFRIVQDISGDYFVYTRPVVPRPLDLAFVETNSV